MKNPVSLLLLGILLSCGGAKAPAAGTLNAPTNLSVSLDGQLCALLSWEDNCTDEDGYFLFLQGPGLSETSVSLPANTTSYKTPELQPEQSYTFALQAFRGKADLSLRVSFPAVSTPEADPNPIQAITLQWTQEQAPSGVKIYKTTSKLNGRNFNAWYAVADCSGDVQLRVLYPGAGNKKTVDAQAQAEASCLVLVNGGIFGSSKPNGFALCDGVQTPWFRVEDDNWDVDRQYWGPTVNGKADGKLHTVSRGLFGVDAQGCPGVYWSYTPSYGTVYVYDRPIPSVEGEPVRPAGTQTYPCAPASWVPYNAITCGPVLLHEGRCPINANKTAKGYWETNYEMWASDIFGVDQRHDRTAVGYLPDGRVVLLVADGRTDDSEGATTLEMAAIMKGLGCVGALNLDGGGSTGMWVKGRGHINDLTADANRPILTTIGFFSR